MKQRTVYLDQNVWVSLLKEKEEKTRDPTIRKSLDAVLETSRSEAAIFPLSINHLIETSWKGNEKERERLFRFMFDVSRGNAIIPYSSRIANWEIEDAVRRRVGFPATDLSPFVIGKGFSFLFGSRPDIVKKNKNSPDIPEELKRKLLQKFESVDTLIMDMRDREAVRKMSNWDVELLEKLERSRRADGGIKDKDLRRRVNMARFFRDLVTPEMTRVALTLGLGPKTVSEKVIGATEEDIEALLKAMPTLYASWQLTFRRDVQFHRKIETSDLYDIAALSIAIPYCDIVVAEKAFTSMALQAKLDTLYDTIILSSTKDLCRLLI
nr:hypothetical protein [Candidatus Njordarchaeum guaymaensis]